MFRFEHVNLNITNPDKSLAFYEKALGLSIDHINHAEDGSFSLYFLSDDAKKFFIELTYLRDHPQPYNLGDNETHLAFITDDFDASHALHKEMGCICFENHEMGIYFINDPDGYWLEVIPSSHRTQSKQ